MNRHKQKRFGYAVYLTVVILAAVLFFFAAPQLHWTPPPDYEVGKWLQISPKEATTSEGNPTTTYLRVGRENKTIVFFCGGGISYNEYTAARPYGQMEFPNGFYSESGSDVLEWLMGYGILSEQPENPFRDWNIIIIPYSTADFHVGTGDYSYTTLQGESAVLHHHGYKNYQAIMKEALRYIPETKSLLICGYSAGGFGASLLAEDIIANFYPDAENITLCADSSLLLLDNWHDIFTDIWKAPKSITQNIQSENLIVNAYKSLYEKYGNRIKFLYVSSLWDGELCRYQSYADYGEFSASNEDANDFAKRLETMLNQLREAIPELGIYIYDKLPYSFSPDQIQLTQHTILSLDMVYWPLMDNVSVIDWLYRAVNNHVETYLPPQITE